MAEKLYVVIDEGCQECGVPSVPIGIYRDRPTADDVAETRNWQTQEWRAGGQTFASVYEMEAPA